MEDAQRVTEANGEWNIQFMSGKSKVPRIPRSLQWEPPPQDWIKCNFDCSYKEGSIFTGIGGIVRNHKGDHICYGMAKLENVNSPLQGEALAFLYVLQQVWTKGWRRVWFEGDNKELECIINIIVIDHIQLGNIILYIQYWMSLLSDQSLGCVNRERNMAADALSKHSMEDQSLVVFNTILLFWLVRFLYWSYTI